MRQELLENPPRLAPEVLQKLLSEAYHPLSKQLTTLREEDCEGGWIGFVQSISLNNNVGGAYMLICKILKLGYLLTRLEF